LACPRKRKRHRGPVGCSSAPAGGDRYFQELKNAEASTTSHPTGPWPSLSHTHTTLLSRDTKASDPSAGSDRIDPLFIFHEIEVEAEKEEDGSMGGEE